MTCSCGSENIVKVSGKVSDTCFITFGGIEKDGYVPGGLNIGSGDYLRISFCADCGKIQGKFPVNVKAALNPDDFDEDEDD